MSLILWKKKNRSAPKDGAVTLFEWGKSKALVCKFYQKMTNKFLIIKTGYVLVFVILKKNLEFIVKKINTPIFDFFHLQ